MKNENLNRMRVQSGKWLLLFVLGLFSMGAFAQQFNVNGTVTAVEDGLPIPGVSVVVKGTAIGTITDMDGKYHIKAERGNVLVFSFIGMQSTEVKVTGKVHNLNMKGDLVSLDEVVAIGYGVQKKKELTGAVVQVKNEDLAKTTTSDIGAALQGQIAGVSVTSNSGQPGSEAGILIRGFSSIMEGNNQPLYVVDGIPYDGDPKLSISEIETMDVLKDAASASIYGTRGAAGVILITTKQGKAGMMTVSVDSEYGLQHITSGVDLLSASETVYVDLIRSEQGITDDKTLASLEHNISRNRDQFSNNTNLENTIQNDWASIQNHSINISGGKEGLKHNFTMNYYNQEGVIINSKYARFNARANTIFTKGKWKINTSIGFRRDEQDYASGGILNWVYRYPAYREDINLDDTSAQATSDDDNNEANRIGSVAKQLLRTDERVGNNHFGNAQFEYSATKDLKITFRGGANYTDNTRIKIVPNFVVYNSKGELLPSTPAPSNQTISDTYSKYTGEAIVSYNKKFNGGHKLNLVATASLEETSFSYFWAKKEGPVSEGIDVLDNYLLNATAGSDNRDYVQTLVGSLVRAQYNYKGKYLASASVRRDGSSQFAEENRWGFFPSASVGWNVSDESFWEPIKGVVNTFKIRASYGRTGNDRFTRYSYNAVVDPNNPYVWNSGDTESLASGSAQLRYANPLVKWETSIEENLGFDFYLFNNKLSFSADLYNSYKEDLLFDVIAPPSVGVSGGDSKVVMNVGNMKNSGVELTMNYRHKKGPWEWNAGVTFTKNKNEITKTSESNPFINIANSYYSNRATSDDLVSVITEGYEAGAFFVLQQKGVINTQEQLDAYKATLDPSETVRLGDLMYVDQLTVDTNGDGIADAGDGFINEDDRAYVGSGLADFEMGLNFGASYKNIDFSMQWFGSYGSEIMNGSKAYAYQSGTHKDLLYGWTPQNTSTTIPAYRGAQKNTDSYRANSDYYMEDGSYIRLRNVSLGYTLPKSMLSSVGIQFLRVYVAAQNPLTITNYSGFDPEIGGSISKRGLDRGDYPVTSQYRMGLQFKF
ncbi:SusC/RagA family TonB-linked outer membrane protein [Labilibacter marinus]|uniref:SusC/RagA family TonB-linked outer membrane protein n=1 Tax=Labilibacter marinus TaxID=1477105 RepID=UPI00082CA450|nr:TonB-dependent receptor [Labilibacter marinus]